jgi:uncharacterized protein (DUF58 family)
MSTSRSLSRTIQTSLLKRFASTARIITPVGWVLLITGLAVLVVGHFLGWLELTTLGVVFLVLVGGSLLFALGHTELEVELDLRPPRISAGQRALAQVVVRSGLQHRILGVRMELRVGEGYAEFSVPSLAAHAEHDEPFVLPTVRRGVITVGPAMSVRSDPFGLVRRTQVWTGSMDLVVHPRLERLAELGAGFVRDLEGQGTNRRSDSDVSFQTIRTYEPGDDQRQIHWMSTARAGELMVKQFIETRRSHVGLLVDGDLATFATEEDAETAISVVGSFGARVFQEDQQVTCVIGDQRLPSLTRGSLLDGLATVDLRPHRGVLHSSITQLIRIASGLSLAVVVTGARTSIDDIRRTALRFPPGISVIMLRVDTESPMSFQPIGNNTLLSLRTLSDLPTLLWALAS